MSMFGHRRPRKFHHLYIYVDERKERLGAIEEKAKRELGMLPPGECHPENLRGRFVQGTSHLHRKKEKGADGFPPLYIGVAVLVTVLLLGLFWINGLLVF